MEPLNPDSESVLKTIDIQQSMIQRMSSSSAAAKNWCITVATAVVAIAVDKGKAEIIFASIPAIVLFMVVDLYYLTLERAARSKYECFVQKIRSESAGRIDLFDVTLPAMTFKDTTSALCSRSVWPFYTFISVCLIVTFYLIE